MRQRVYEDEMDERQFESRVRALTGRLWRVAYSILGNGADCDDALQEALLRAWRGLSSLRDVDLFETWLTRILINECKRLLAARIRRFAAPLDETLPAPAYDAEPGDAIGALKRLKPRERVPLTLNVIGGYNIAEVAELLKMPYYMAYKRVRRAKKQMEAILSKGDKGI